MQFLTFYRDEGQKIVQKSTKVCNLLHKTLDRRTMHTKKVNFLVHTHFFYRQLDFQSEPEVVNVILENEPKSCLAVA